MSADMKKVKAAADDLYRAILTFERAAIEAEAYLPGIATRLRIYADEMADKYPDDTNGGGLI